MTVLTASRRERLAPLGVCLLIQLLSFGPTTFLFPDIEPGALGTTESTIFNLLVACIFISFAKVTVTDSGKTAASWSPEDTKTTTRTCRKCNGAPKAPRMHHCRVCNQCTAKMQHHCFYAAACIGFRNHADFIRFLFYAVTSMGFMQYFLFVRILTVWQNRHVASYLGPSAGQLTALFAFAILNSVTCIAVGVIFLRSLYGLFSNTTDIEGWEIERHEALVRRAKRQGGFLEAPGGAKIELRRHEFPYDVGIWSNFVQVMGKSPFSWFNPFAPSPPIKSGLQFETNGIGDAWPPPDPEKLPNRRRLADAVLAPASDQRPEATESDRDRMEAFRRRQAADFARRARQNEARYADGSQDDVVPETQQRGSKKGTVQEPWRNSEGERLEDFGVDENEADDTYER